MRTWTVTIDIGDASKGPAFLRIARAISDEVRRGRLRAGDALPGSRTLADQIGVHRNTVLAAYRELEAEGWIETQEARGTFVSKEIPDVAPRRFDGKRRAERVATATRTSITTLGFDIPPQTPEDRLDDSHAQSAQLPPRTSHAEGPSMSLGGGIPDVRLVPAAALARAMRRVLARQPLDVLSYGEPEGLGELRQALAGMVAATRGVPAREENVLVTRGSQMAVHLVARTLVSPGDVIAVEALGYRPAWSALRAAGATIVPVPVDARGIDVDALARLASERRLRGVYVTPHHQYPTTVTLAPARRLRLLELARAHRLFVLEDDYDHEFHYEGRPVLPLASADANGVVIYVGTLSKVLAPGLRTGFLVAAEPLVARLASIRRTTDRQGDRLLERAIADLLEEGEIQRHIRRTKRIYGERRAYVASLLERHLGSVLSFELPSGGTAIWAKVASDVSVDAWSERALELGLILQGAKRFAFDGKPRPFLRVGFAQHDEREAREAVRRMVNALPSRATERSRARTKTATLARSSSL
ncbi:Transcriptional regulator, GntR family domain / Aspartate aminotransferase [Labilithrix luteola]|uniref:Transcriptional regulator, GntR family domain / Aspartate aminotransferase n=1 Tax=Labilithrix luteola TaxID=1391654 RepID=A0A0K1QC81_9BACT|nr:PLP-dependent aminotransferase family protein [Labilithrix luteola]AKV03040.1 Transcriptional regulator, GntR family domain / Aspartate aminotransferase [Labilithrix luteola]